MSKAADYRRDVTRGIGEAKWTFWKVFWPLVVLVVVLSITGHFLGWFGEAAQVTREEFGPRAALEKYEWFIDQAASVAKMDQDVENFWRRLSGVESQYASYGENKALWPPDVRFQYNRAYEQARDDLLAMISQRNSLVREYNAASAKFNWAGFRTRPDMPEESFAELDLDLP